MKKVIIDGRCMFDSGIGIYLQEMLKQFSLSNHKISLILNPEQVIKAKSVGIEIDQFIEVEFSRFSLKNVFALNKVLSEYDYFFAPALSVMPLFASVKKIVTIHDLCPFVHRKFFGKKIAYSYWLLIFLQLCIADKVVSISRFTKSEIERVYTSVFSKKIKVIPNGVSCRFNDVKADEISEDIISLGNQNIILCVGNVKPHKNISKLVNFFINQKNLTDKYKLVIVGESDGFRTKSKEIFPKSDHYIFTGFVSDAELDFLYSKSKFFVFPSLYEGFGLPLLEAMQHNLNILASDIPVFREIALEQINYFDPQSFEGFEMALSDSNPSCSYQGVLEKYSWENTMSSFSSKVLK